MISKLFKASTLVGSMLFLGLLFQANMFFAQDGELVIHAAKELGRAPEQIQNLFSQFFGKFFVTIAAFTAMSAAVSAGLIQRVKALKDSAQIVKQLVSWAVAAAFCFIGYWMNAGVFAEMTLAASLGTSVSIGLQGNGVWDFVNGLMKLTQGSKA